MKLWGGRFTKKTDELAQSFNESFSFDKRLYKQDIRGSIAHAAMLGKQEILSKTDTRKIINGLKSIEKDIESGKLKADAASGYEDIHSFIEGTLTERIGDAGKRLHTGRSRNDQVALDMKLFARDELDEVTGLLTGLLEEILKIMEENTDTVMPGFTHLQKAQPTTLAHHFGAYFEMFLRDRDRMKDCRKRLNLCPLGSGAFAGTTYPLDRKETAKLLGFDGPTRNSMDSVSDRDYLIEFLSDLSLTAMHLSRLSEELIIWNTDEYRFVEMDDSYSTGSSIMPQKKNPDIAELIRGKSGRVYGDLMGLLTVMKGLPLAYDKDMQEDKEGTFDAVDTVKDSLKLMHGMLSTLKFSRERMEDSAKGGYTNATDAADYLVRKGVPFRDAHAISGKLVLLGIRERKPLQSLTLEEFRSVSPVFEKDIYDAISLKTCIGKRNTVGAPGPKAIRREIAECRKLI
jgi:argininosuccinate lyase